MFRIKAAELKKPVRFLPLVKPASTCHCNGMAVKFQHSACMFTELFGLSEYFCVNPTFLKAYHKDCDVSLDSVLLGCTLWIHF